MTNAEQLEARWAMKNMCQLTELGNRKSTHSYSIQTLYKETAQRKQEDVEHMHVKAKSKLGGGGQRKPMMRENAPSLSKMF